MHSENRKPKFNFVYIFIAIIVSAFAAFQYSSLSDDITVSFKEEQVQEKINSFPLSTISKYGINVNVHHFKVDFLETDKVLIDVDFLVNGYSMEAIGKGVLKTSIRYNNGDFYIHEPEFKDFKLTVQKQKGEVEKIKNVLLNSFTGIKNKFSNKEQNAVKDIAKSFVSKYEPQVKALLDSEIKRILQEKPVYSLNNKDIKQSIAALMIQDIKFTDKEVIATLKPTGVLKSPIFIISGILVLLMLLVFAIVGRR